MRKPIAAVRVAEGNMRNKATFSAIAQLSANDMLKVLNTALKTEHVLKNGRKSILKR